MHWDSFPIKNSVYTNFKMYHPFSLYLSRVLAPPWKMFCAKKKRICFAALLLTRLLKRLSFLGCCWTVRPYRRGDKTGFVWAWSWPAIHAALQVSQSSSIQNLQYKEIKIKMNKSTIIGLQKTLLEILFDQIFWVNLCNNFINTKERCKKTFSCVELTHQGLKNFFLLWFVWQVHL